MKEPIAASFESELTRAPAKVALSVWLAPAVLIAADLTSFVLGYGGMLTLGLVNLWDAGPITLFALIALACLLLYYRRGLYPGYQLHHHEHLRRRTLAACAVAGVIVPIVLLLRGADDALGLLLFMAISLLPQPFLRSILRQNLYQAGQWGMPVEIVGEVDRVEILTSYFTRHWEYGLIPTRESHEFPRAQVMQRTGLVAAQDVPSGDQLSALRQRYSTLLLLADMPDLRLTGLPSCGFTGRIAMTLGREDQLSFWRQRLFDLSIALPALVIAAPVLLVAGGLLFLCDRGPIFYSQPREGRAGRMIKVLKLRTMYQDADQRLAKLLEENQAAREEWFSRFKLQKDPRILPGIGPFLRATSLDELPQLLNVLAGEMSIVGPRPFPAYHLEAMDPDFRLKRRSVTPGLTGLWQVSARGTSDLEMQRQLDSFYIDNRSLWFDIYIVLRTFSALFHRSGT